MAATALKLSLKLLIDKERNKVVFAEADKEFVDILFSFLTLSMGSFIDLLGKKTCLGSIDRLYETVSKFDDRCFQTPACRGMLLSPRSSAAIRCHGLAFELDKKSEPWTYYRCFALNPFCPLSSVFEARCPCGRITDVPVQAVGRQDWEKSVKGFVKEAASFIVSDDLVIRPASTGATLALFHELGIHDGNILEKKIIHMGREEILNLLKRSLISKN